MDEHEGPVYVSLQVTAYSNLWSLRGFIKIFWSKAYIMLSFDVLCLKQLILINKHKKTTVKYKVLKSYI